MPEGTRSSAVALGEREAPKHNKCKRHIARIAQLAPDRQALHFIGSCGCQIALALDDLCKQMQRLGCAPAVPYLPEHCHTLLKQWAGGRRVALEIPEPAQRRKRPGSTSLIADRSEVCVALLQVRVRRGILL